MDLTVRLERPVPYGRHRSLARVSLADGRGPGACVRWRLRGVRLDRVAGRSAQVWVGDADDAAFAGALEAAVVAAIARYAKAWYGKTVGEAQVAETFGTCVRDGWVAATWPAVRPPAWRWDGAPLADAAAWLQRRFVEDEDDGRTDVGLRLEGVLFADGRASLLWSLEWADVASPATAEVEPDASALNAWWAARVADASVRADAAAAAARAHAAAWDAWKATLQEGWREVQAAASAQPGASAASAAWRRALDALESWHDRHAPTPFFK